MTPRDGYALPLTLAAIIVIALVAAIAAQQVRTSTRTITDLTDQLRLRTQMVSAENTLIYELLTEPMTQRGLAVGQVSDPLSMVLGGAVVSDDTPILRVNGTAYRFSPESEIVVRAYDDQSFFNINSYNPDYSSAVLNLYGVPEVEHARFAAALRDYQDEDGLRTLGGAEAGDYEVGGLPTNKPLRDALEVCAIKYWDESAVCADPGRLLLTARTRGNDLMVHQLVSEPVLDLMMPDASAQEVRDLFAEFSNETLTSFNQIGAPEFDVIRDPLSIVSAPGPVLTLLIHTPDTRLTHRVVLELTPNSLISPFVVHSKYAIGGDYTQNILRIERLDDVAPLPQPTSIRTER
ncbi:Type II secretion system (T2SS) protein K [Oceanicaulis sp. 350]|nr:Type II secretion system (T2SS) protein K [Oceanicaulis sp. 350]